LYLLDEAIRGQNIATYIEVVSGAKIPIVKFDHVSGVSVDILCNNSDGMQTAKLMKKYVREFPPLKPLTVLLKVFLVSLFLPPLLFPFPSRALTLPRAKES
jgi:non-canonical poly(A) RNA polymerase PAPD5/7